MPSGNKKVAGEVHNARGTGVACIAFGERGLPGTIESTTPVSSSRGCGRESVPAGVVE